MNAGTSTTSAVRDFAAAVRDALDDLPADEIDDLTDGLEADLAEQALDTGVDELGDPVAYADELRAAAGLRAREESNPAASRANSALAAISRLWADLRRGVRSHPTTSAALDFALALRPLWWVARGWLGYSYFVFFSFIRPEGSVGLASIVPETTFGWLVVAVFVIVSVQWGRGRWLPWPWLRWARIVASVLAVLAVPVAISGAVSDVDYMRSAMNGDLSPVSSSGLRLNGAPVSNVFAYDSDGNPVSNVRLYDQDGLPLTGSGGDDSLTFSYVSAPDGTMSVLVPGPAPQGDTGWNIYPLREIPQDEADTIDQTGALPDSVQPTTSLPPFFSLAPLPPADSSLSANGATGDPADGTAAGTAPAPTATPTSPATRMASPTPTPSPTRVP